MYHVVPLLRDKIDFENVGVVGAGQSLAGTIIEGPLEGYTIIAAPVRLTQKELLGMEEKAKEVFGEKVIVITNNVHFLKAVQLTGKEEVKVLQSSKPNIKKLVEWIKEGVGI